MIEWLRSWFREEEQQEEEWRPSVRDYILHINRRTYYMAIDLRKLTAAVERNTKALDALLTAHTDPALQAAVDTAADTLDKKSAEAEAAVTPPAAT
jgi:hypothetical protein